MPDPRRLRRRGERLIAGFGRPGGAGGARAPATPLDAGGPETSWPPTTRLPRGRPARAPGRACASPALVICGGDDPFTPPRLSEELARELPPAQMVVIPGAGTCRWPRPRHDRSADGRPPRPPRGDADGRMSAPVTSRVIVNPAATRASPARCAPDGHAGAGARSAWRVARHRGAGQRRRALPHGPPPRGQRSSSTLGGDGTVGRRAGALARRAGRAGAAAGGQRQRVRPGPGLAAPAAAPCPLLPRARRAAGCGRRPSGCWTRRDGAGLRDQRRRRPRRRDRRVGRGAPADEAPPAPRRASPWRPPCGVARRARPPPRGQRDGVGEIEATPLVACGTPYTYLAGGRSTSSRARPSTGASPGSRLTRACGPTSSAGSCCGPSAAATRTSTTPPCAAGRRRGELLVRVPRARAGAGRRRAARAPPRGAVTPGPVLRVRRSAGPAPALKSGGARTDLITCGTWTSRLR